MSPEYGEDHQLTNNWNPDEDYGNQYVDVHFRIRTPSYSYPSFSFKKDDEKAFYKEVKDALEPLGWDLDVPIENKVQDGAWHCDYIVNGKQKLYLHPQNFSGEVLKNNVRQIAEALQGKTTFSLEWVNLYDTVYDISDKDYIEYLIANTFDIKKLLFERSATKRTGYYLQSYSLCESVGNSIGVKLVGKEKFSGVLPKFVFNVMDDMVADGLLIKSKEPGYVRSLNKTEMRKYHKQFVTTKE